jgi:hypothetical protein
VFNSVDAVAEEGKVLLECLEHVSVCGGVALDLRNYCLRFLCLLLCAGPYLIEEESG